MIKRASRGDVVSACLNRSSLWRYVKVIPLTINMRLRKLSSQDSLEVSEFCNFLLRVGEGTEPEDENQMIHIDPKFVVPGNDISGSVSAVYGDIVNNYLDQRFMCQRIIMSPNKETCDAINAHVMQLIPGDADTFVSADSVEDSQAAMYPTEFLNSLSPNGITINKGQGQSLETVGIFLPSPESIFGHGQLYFALSRVQNPRGLKIMVCGGSEYASGGVLFKNVVYREVFLTPVEKPLSSCSDQISSFSQDVPILSSHCIPILSPVKRGSIGDYYERESKVSKIFEFSDSDVIALEDPRECVLLSNDISFGSPDNISCEVTRFPRDMTEHSDVTSVNNFTLPMRLNLAHSIGLGTEEIIPNREVLSIRGTYLRYYTSLTTK